MGVMNKISENTVNLEAKNLLAKLLASEDITVQHQHVHTASFHVESRILTLPTWEKMDDSLYDMLVGHEVGHALFTPNELDEAIAAINPEGDCSRATTFDYLNVVEDSRIERLMQNKFPGLRRDFVRSYNDLFIRKFFGDVEEEDVNSRRLVDRVNLHYKVGRLMQINFSAEEQAVVDMIDRADTWEEIVEATRALFILGREEAEKKAKEEEEMSDAQGMPSPMCGDGDEEADSEGMSASAGDEGSEDTDGDGNGSGGDEESEDADADGDGGGSGGDDDSSDAEGNMSDDGGAGNPDIDDRMKSETARNLADKMQDELVQDIDPHKRVNFYTSIPDVALSNYITSVPEFIKTCREYSSLNSVNDHRWIQLSNQLKRFEQDTKKIVAGMVQRFEMMKAASEHKRTMTSSSGSIDMSKLMNYKWDDDIFLKMESIAEGKSHGMIMYVDWSGSMANIAIDTIKQVLILSMFCKKINIPFSCYAFIGGFKNMEVTTDPEKVVATYNKINNGDVAIGDIRLVEIAGSKYDKTTSNQGAAFWLGVAHANDNNSNGFRYPVSSYRMLGTPLDDTIALGVNIANDFRAQHGIEILNTVILTDGCTSGSPLDYNSQSWNEETRKFIFPYNTISEDVPHSERPSFERVLSSKVTGKTYSKKNRWESTTSVMMRYYRDHTKSNTTCIQICPRNRKDIGYWVSRMTPGLDPTHLDWQAREDIVDQIWKKGAIAFENLEGFDQFIFMSSPDQKKVKGLDDVAEGANTRTLANAFIREKQNRKKVTQIMDQFVDYISKECV